MTIDRRDPTPCEKCGEVHAGCAAHRRDGLACTQHPLAGQRVCRMHGGRTPGALAKGRENMLTARIALLGKYGTASPDWVEIRFWARVDRTEGCWLWTGATLGAGYGRLTDPRGGPRATRAEILAHRLSWELAHGEAIPDGLEVDHLCHEAACVNPAHLRLATRGQNLQNRAGGNSGSTTGVRGVALADGRYTARFTLDRKVYHVGSFDTLAEAEAAVSAARGAAMPFSAKDREGLL